jgi:hypothetical protein
MGGVTGLVADPHRHNHLMVSIDHQLAVVALDSAVSAFVEVAVGIGEAALGFAVDLSGPIDGEVAAGQWPGDRSEVRGPGAAVQRCATGSRPARPGA